MYVTVLSAVFLGTIVSTTYVYRQINKLNSNDN